MRAAILLLILLWAGLCGCEPNQGPAPERSAPPGPMLAAPIANAKPLPHSMKGYELYSWRQERGDGWRHALITGTNRLKSYEEVIDGENQETQSGWVKITVAGTEELKALLERLPAGSYISWQSGDRLLGEPAATATVMLPESGTVDAIQRHGRQLDIQVHVER